ncbi:MAG TPA: SDR family oxidoreductase [Chryseosolibacter sp.]|nr:SDR family oxidoreductase [Chryseosolibacter sp.]
MADNAKANRYALVTGATSGFGFEFSKLLAKDGYNLVLVARDEQRLMQITDDLTQTFMIETIPIAKDLFSPTAAEEIYTETKAKGIDIEILINDAGQGQHGNFIEYDIARDVDMIQLNITSLVALTKFYLNDMVARDSGKILQIASILGEYPTPYMSVYAATKAFVISFSAGLQNELKDTKVTVTTLLPGASDTDFFHKAGAEHTVTYREEKLSKPEDVAKDGYDALMKGESKITSGLKNKAYTAMTAVLPEGAKAASMEKQMQPSEKEKGRERITHGPSIEERERIDLKTGRENGDYNEHEDHVHKNENEGL